MPIEVQSSRICLVKVTCQEGPDDYLELEPRGDHLRIESHSDGIFQSSVHLYKSDVKSLIDTLIEIEKDMT